MYPCHYCIVSSYLLRFRLGLLKVKNLKHQTSHITFPINNIWKPVKGLFNSCNDWVFQSIGTLLCVLNLFVIYSKMVAIFGLQITLEHLNASSTIFQPLPNPVKNPKKKNYSVCSIEDIKKLYMIYFPESNKSFIP